MHVILPTSLLRSKASKACDPMKPLVPVTSTCLFSITFQSLATEGAVGTPLVYLES